MAPRQGGVVVVTGASRGIGRACALRLAAAGLHVAAVARSADLLGRVVEDCSAKGPAARAFVVDLAGEGATQALVEQVLGWRGRLDVLVNNAGRFAHGPLDQLEERTLEQVVGLNLTSIARLTRQCIPPLCAAPAGLCVNIASVAGLQGFANEAIYAASKHAVVGLSRSLFLELRQHGVGCSVICPGLVATEMADHRGARLEWALQADDIAAAVDYVVASPAHACPTELVLQPTRPPL